MCQRRFVVNASAVCLEASLWNVLQRGAGFGYCRRLVAMRIAIPIHSFEPGGVERVALRLAGSWQDAGHEPIVVLGRDRGPCRIVSPDLDYWSLGEPCPTDRWETLWIIWSLFQFLLTEKVDAVFCPGNTYTVVCVAMKLLLGDRCPPILVKISNDLERRDIPRGARPFYRWWLKVQGAWLDGFVAMANPIMPEIERELSVSNDRISVIPNPVLSQDDLCALSERRVNRSSPSGCRFLTVGRLVAQKNQTMLLEAFAKHCRPDDTLVIAGEGPEKDRLAKFADALGIAEQVRFAGHVENTHALYAEADVFVLSSHYEGLPGVVIEALATGLPLAVTDCCASMAWLTGNGQFGVTVAPGDADALSSGMNLARHLRPDRDAMHRLAAKFTLEHSSEIYLSTIQRLIVRHRQERMEKLDGGVRLWHGGGV